MDHGAKRAQLECGSRDDAGKHLAFCMCFACLASHSA
jgi:hypothetical protein